MNSLRLVEDEDAPQSRDVTDWTGYNEALQMPDKSKGLRLVDDVQKYRSRFMEGFLDTCVIPDYKIDFNLWKNVVSFGGFKKVILDLDSFQRTVELIRQAAKGADETKIFVDDNGEELPAYSWIAKRHIDYTNGDYEKLFEMVCKFDSKADKLENSQIITYYLPAVQKILKLTTDELTERYSAWELAEQHRASQRVLQQSILHAQKHLNDGRPDLARTSLFTGYEQSNQIYKEGEGELQTMADQWPAYLERIKRWRGRPIIGLDTDMKQLTDCLCGLRGLILLAADTNVGKTLLAMQLAVQALIKQLDLCVVFVSIEMSLDSLLGRIGANSTADTWKGFVIEGSDDKQRAATEATKSFMDRMIFMGMEDLEECEISILNRVQELKKKTGCKRIMIVVDYVQMLPIPTKLAEALRSDLDADRYRIEALRHLKNAVDEDDAVLAISEVNKGRASGRLTHKDIMGSARLAYAPDTLLFWQLLSDKEKYEWFNTTAAGLIPLSTPKKLPRMTKDTAEEVAEHAEEVDKMFELLNTKPGWLEIAKGRDGTRRASIPITAYYDRLTIEEGFFQNGRLT